MAETGTEPVTEVVGSKFGLAVNNLNRSFGTGRHTKAATVAFLFINNDNFPDHVTDSSIGKITRFTG
jgi:hypothetical protein